MRAERQERRLGRPPHHRVRSPAIAFTLHVAIQVSSAWSVGARVQPGTHGPAGGGIALRPGEHRVARRERRTARRGVLLAAATFGWIDRGIERRDPALL